MDQTDVATAEGSARRPDNGPMRNLSKDYWYKARSRLIALWIAASWLPATFSKSRVIEGSWIDFGITSLAWICFAAGLTFRLWPTLYIAGRKAGRVVADGPYSICRNPLYLGTFLVYLSQALFLKSAFFGVGLLVPLLVYLWAVIPAEEQHLLEKFGEDYAQYRRAVPCLWLKWSLYQSSERLDMEVRGLNK